MRFLVCGRLVRGEVIVIAGLVLGIVLGTALGVDAKAGAFIVAFALIVIAANALLGRKKEEAEPSDGDPDGDPASGAEEQ